MHARRRWNAPVRARGLLAYGAASRTVGPARRPADADGGPDIGRGIPAAIAADCMRGEAATLRSAAMSATVRRDVGHGAGRARHRSRHSRRPPRTAACRTPCSSSGELWHPWDRGRPALANEGKMPSIPGVPGTGNMGSHKSDVHPPPPRGSVCAAAFARRKSRDSVALLERAALSGESSCSRSPHQPGRSLQPVPPAPPVSDPTGFAGFAGSAGSKGDFG